VPSNSIVRTRVSDYKIRYFGLKNKAQVSDVRSEWRVFVRIDTKEQDDTCLDTAFKFVLFVSFVDRPFDWL
jgi:hypothetical protein